MVAALRQNRRVGRINQSRKPPFGSRVIPGHPLAPTHAYLFNEGGGSTIIDSARAGHGYMHLPQYISWEAEGVRFAGNGSYILLPLLPTIQTSLEPHSYVIGMRREATSDTTYGTLLKKGTGTGNLMGYSLVRQAGVPANTWYPAYNTYTVASTITAEVDYILAYTVEGDDFSVTCTQKAWINGIQQTSDTGTGGGQGSGVSWYIGSAAGDHEFNGLITFVYLYDHALTEEQAVAVSRNPFCMFAPPRPRIVYSIPAGVTIKPWYYYQRNKMRRAS